MNKSIKYYIIMILVLIISLFSIEIQMDTINILTLFLYSTIIPLVINAVIYGINVLKNNFSKKDNILYSAIISVISMLITGIFLYINLSKDNIDIIIENTKKLAESNSSISLSNINVSFDISSLVFLFAIYLVLFYFTGMIATLISKKKEQVH
ncbi:hypothetical protein [Clostridium sp.]|uniref:hypothetical protein n=1 Tax=Clostridium sp. TaxID=1506 RepID=UPI0028498987|nr:hypothetical protein [Clostridium sp.]MDR3596027.1 hypothetical protein [Clostridium sp.]